MTDLTQQFERLKQKRFERRRLLQTAGIGGAAAMAGGMGLASPSFAQSVSADVEVFQFALNLEYLEAEYYLRGVTGTGLTATQITGTGNSGATTGGTTVPFTSSALAYYFIDIASQENQHVNFLRSALGADVIAKPEIDLVNSFNTLAVAAGLGSSFNPFESDINFLVGAYIFEDVGVTAYAGAASLLTSSANLTYAADVLAVEAYHAGAIRGFLSEIGAGNTTNAISNLRSTLSNQVQNVGTDDYGTNAQGNAFNFASSDYNGLAFRRTPQQVLNIVYGGTSATSGLFFPAGVNGAITSSGI